jgi:hypothetical protein
MAYHRADPTPFKPRGMTVLNIPNRPIMVRTMAHRRPRARNEDLAIVTIDPIPGNVLHFPIVEEVIRECCHSKRAPVKEVQPTHLGQGFVRFQHDYDRDRMVSDSPHLYGGSYFSFVKDNQGRNWRSLTFNFECWVMMMGLLEDYWEDEFIEVVLGPFARIISWYTETTEDDTRVLTYLMVKTKVSMGNRGQFNVKSSNMKIWDLNHHRRSKFLTRQMMVGH